MRNKVLDIMRGHYLLAILVDHIYRVPSIFEYYNGMGNLWISAAEGFIFISGLLLGIINFPKIKTHGMKFVTTRLLKRALKLHVVSVTLTVVYSLVGLHYGNYPYLGQGIKYERFPDILLNALTLRYSYGWADLLLLYVILVAVSPIVIYLIHKKMWGVVLAISFALWFYNIYNPKTLYISGSVFPVLSWQFLFILGMIIGKYRHLISKIYKKLVSSHQKLFVSLLTVIFSITLYASYLDIYGHLFSGRTKEVLDFIFIKLELGPGRILLFLIWFLFLYSAVHVFYKYIDKYFGWLYFKFGKNSLLTYVVQSIILFVWFYIPKDFIPNTFWVNSLLNILVIMIVWLVVTIAVWYNQKAKILMKH